MSISPLLEQPAKRKPIYYGWVIVIVGFLAHIASAFSISSTLSVFLKPLSADLGISRGTFSLIRSGEILIGAAAAPVVGTLMDRYGGRWLMAVGGLISGAGFICLGQARDFTQFMLVRWLLISPGDSFMGSMVVNVSISRWFVRMRGRALAIAGMGHGLAKVCMPVAAATLMLYVGWRGAWVVFGVFALLLVVAPALLFMRRSPEEMGLLPDGGPVGVKAAVATAQKPTPHQAHRRRQCRVEPKRGAAHAGFLAHRQHLRRRPDRRHRAQSPCIFLCNRSRSSNPGGGVGDEHHRGHAVQHADSLGHARGPHG